MFLRYVRSMVPAVEVLSPNPYLPRLNYFDPDGNKVKGVTKGSCLTYLGKNVQGFAECFAKWGMVQVPYGQLSR